MKYLILLSLLAARSWGQFIVNDPANTAVNTAVQAGQAANHLEVMRQWADQLERMNRQLRQLEQQLAVQQRIRDVMGDPAAAGGILRNFGAVDLARQYGETLSQARRLANAIESLRRTSEGIYRSLDDRTSLGKQFPRQESIYRRFAAVERQADNLAEAEAQAEARSATLQADIADTVERLRTASTQAEVDKLNIRLAALNGQLAHLEQQRAGEARKLTVQHVLNENQAAKEKQDLLESQLAEERDSFAVTARWQEAISITPTDFTRK